MSILCQLDVSIQTLKHSNSSSSSRNDQKLKDQLNKFHQLSHFIKSQLYFCHFWFGLNSSQDGELDGKRRRFDHEKESEYEILFGLLMEPFNLQQTNQQSNQEFTIQDPFSSQDNFSFLSFLNSFISSLISNDAQQSMINSSLLRFCYEIIDNWNSFHFQEDEQDEVVNQLSIKHELLTNLVNWMLNSSSSSTTPNHISLHLKIKFVDIYLIHLSNQYHQKNNKNRNQIINSKGSHNKENQSLNKGKEEEKKEEEEDEIGMKLASLLTIQSLISHLIQELRNFHSRNQNQSNFFISCLSNKYSSPTTTFAENQNMIFNYSILNPYLYKIIKKYEKLKWLINIYSPSAQIKSKNSTTIHSHSSLNNQSKSNKKEKKSTLSHFFSSSSKSNHTSSSSMDEVEKGEEGENEIKRCKSAPPIQSSSNYNNQLIDKDQLFMSTSIFNYLESSSNNNNNKEQELLEYLNTLFNNQISKQIFVIEIKGKKLMNSSNTNNQVTALRRKMKPKLILKRNLNTNKEEKEINKLNEEEEEDEVGKRCSYISFYDPFNDNQDEELDELIMLNGNKKRSRDDWNQEDGDNESHYNKEKKTRRSKSLSPKPTTKNQQDSSIQKRFSSLQNPFSSTTTTLKPNSSLTTCVEEYVIEYFLQQDSPTPPSRRANEDEYLYCDHLISSFLDEMPNIPKYYPMIEKLNSKPHLRYFDLYYHQSQYNQSFMSSGKHYFKDSYLRGYFCENLLFSILKQVFLFHILSNSEDQTNASLSSFPSPFCSSDQLYPPSHSSSQHLISKNEFLSLYESQICQEFHTIQTSSFLFYK